MALSPTGGGQLRYPHEKLFVGYLVFLAALIGVAGAPIADRWIRLVWHVALAAGIWFVFPALGEKEWKSTVRHWLPLVLLAIVYTELDVLNDLFTAEFHDDTIVALEQNLFGTQLAITLREWFPYLPLSEYLHAAYFAYYFLFPGLGIWLFVQGKFNEYRYAAMCTLVTFIVCYTIFIVYPVGGPWNTFERATVDEVGYVAAWLVHPTLISGESVGTAFPSSHVAASLTIWLVSARVDRVVFRIYAFIVPALIVGTMYGGFHYAVDVIPGVAIGIAVAALGPRIYKLFGGVPPEPPARTAIAGR